MIRKIRILLVEDNPADADLTREKLEASKILHDLDHVKDGVEAMEYLRGQGEFEGMELPDLILLDLNLPRKNGRDVLAEVKSDGDLRRIPVVILTSSRDEEDVLRSYDLQASAYVSKPVDLAGFGKIVKAIEGFWFSVVEFPHQESSRTRR